MLQLFVFYSLQSTDLVICTLASNSVVLSFLNFSLVILYLFVHIFYLFFQQIWVVVHWGTSDVWFIVFSLVFILIFHLFKLFLFVFLQNLCDFLDLVLQFPVSLLQILNVFLPAVKNFCTSVVRIFAIFVSVINYELRDPASTVLLLFEAIKSYFLVKWTFCFNRTRA